MRVGRTFALLAVAVGLSVVSTGVSLVVSPTIAHADGGLEVTNNTRYQVQPELEVVTVVVTSTYKNTVPDKREGNYNKRTYFTGAALPVPKTVTDVAVTANGQPLATTRESGAVGLGMDVISFDFASDLYYGEQATIEMRYGIEGGAPRDENDPTRVNAAYVSFDTLAFGDPGRTTMEVVLPLGFTLDKSSTLANAPSVDDATTRTYRIDGESLSRGDAGGVDGLLLARVTATNPQSMKVTTVKAGDADIQIWAWPDDPEWSEFVKQTVTEVTPFLEAMFGTPWPQDQMQIHESGDPNTAFGVADGQGTLIEVGEGLAPQPILRGLAHGWVRSPEFTEPWLNAGLTQHVVATGMSEIYGQEIEPPSDENFGPPLSEWEAPTGASSDDQAAVAESWATVDAIFGAVGDEAIADLFAAAKENSSREQPLADWQVILDVTEPATGDDDEVATPITTILAQHVFQESDAEIATNRNAVRGKRVALVRSAGDWGVPTSVDATLADWQFERSDQLLGWASSVIAKRDALLAKAADADLKVGTDAMKTGYEEAVDEEGFGDVEARIVDLSESVDNVVAAQVAVGEAGGVFDSIGSWFADSSADHLRAAEDALANGSAVAANSEAADAISAADAAPRRGQLRAGIAFAVVMTIGLLTVLLIVRRRRSKRDSNANAVMAAEPPPSEIPQPAPPVATSTSVPIDVAGEPTIDQSGPVPVEEHFDLRPPPPGPATQAPSTEPHVPETGPLDGEGQPDPPSVQPYPPEFASTVNDTQPSSSDGEIGRLGVAPEQPDDRPPPPAFAALATPDPEVEAVAAESETAESDGAKDDDTEVDDEEGKVEADASDQDVASSPPAVAPPSTPEPEGEAVAAESAAVESDGAKDQDGEADGEQDKVEADASDQEYRPPAVGSSLATSDAGDEAPQDERPDGEVVAAAPQPAGLDDDVDEANSAYPDEAFAERSVSRRPGSS